MKKTNGLLELPDGWTQVKIGEVIDKPSLTGKKLPQKEYQFKGLLPVIDQGQTFIGGYTDNEKLKVSCDLPVIVFGDHTKAIKYINFDFVAGADGVKVLKAWDVFYPKLFYYFLQAVSLPDRGYSRHFQFLENASIPIPPLPEQQRIVVKIEELLTKLDAGVDALKQARAQLGRFRQAALEAAVTGDLTREWREAQGGELEPAADLLERILRERRAKWEADQLAKMRAAGKPPKNDNWKQKYQEPAAPDTSELPELPNGWIWVALGQLAWSVKDGPHYSPKYAEEGVPFITGGNVRPSGIDFTSAKRITPELHDELSKRCKPEKGDVLYTKGGTTGIARVNTYDLEFNVWVHVAVLKLIDSARPFYVQHALNSPDCYRQAQKFTHGVGNQDLGLTRMVNIVFAMPSPAEQKQAIDEVEKLLSIADAMEQTIEQSLKQAERLRQSILQQAFAGKLVSQDPNDEPASRLLERIREERAREADAVAPKQKRKSGKRKQATQTAFFS